MNANAKENIEVFFKAILSLKTVEECKAFFKDILTTQEMDAITQRLEVAFRLDRGESYIDINAETGASTATISRVSKYLNSGEGGYKTVIERLGEDDI